MKSLFLKFDEFDKFDNRKFDKIDRNSTVEIMKMSHLSNILIRKTLQHSGIRAVKLRLIC